MNIASLTLQRRVRPSWLILVGVLIVSPPAGAAPPTLKHFFPPGGQRGTSVEVTASGSFETWPVQYWVDRPGITATSEKDKGKLKVQIADDAEPGTYWMRMYQADGASSLCPFVVGTVAEVNEVEPNGGLKEGQAIEGPTVVNGRLGKSGDVDAFRLDLKAGQTLVAALDANHALGSPMDAVMQLCNAAGFTIEQNDDARGTDPMIVWNVPADGTYYVRLFAFPATPNSTIGFSGSNDYVYRLTLTTQAYVDHALPLAARHDQEQELTLFGWNLADGKQSVTIQGPSTRRPATLFASDAANTVSIPVVNESCTVAAAEASVKQPQPVQLPTVISGRVEAEGDEDAFRFAAKKGDKLLFRAESDALGFLLDPLLTLVDSTGKVIGEVDDTSRQRDCELAVTIPADGDYDLRIRDLHRHGGLRYVYRITAQLSQPDFQLGLSQETFVLTPGKPLDVEVTVTRLRGFQEQVQVAALELPAGVQAEPVTSEAKGDSSKKVKLQLTAKEGPVAGTFRIQGTAVETDGMDRFATFSPTNSSTQIDQPWLTVLASSK